MDLLEKRVVFRKRVRSISKVPFITKMSLLGSQRWTLHRQGDWSEDYHLTALMSSSSTPLLSPPEHFDGIERDDELWTQYVSNAADADKQMIDEWLKLVDTILVFVGFPCSRRFSNSLQINNRMHYSSAFFQRSSFLQGTVPNAIQPTSLTTSSSQSIPI